MHAQNKKRFQHKLNKLLRFLLQRPEHQQLLVVSLAKENGKYLFYFFIGR